MDAIDNKIVECMIESEIDHNDINKDNYIEENVIDSLTLLNLVSSLEEKFDIKIDVDDIIPENFVNFYAVRKMIDKYL